MRVGDQLMTAWLFSSPFEWRGFLSLPVHMRVCMPLWLGLGGRAGGGRGWCSKLVEELKSSLGVWAEDDWLRCSSLDNDDCSQHRVH